MYHLIIGCILAILLSLCGAGLCWLAFNFFKQPYACEDDFDYKD